MFKKASVAMIILILAIQLFSGLVFASGEDSQDVIQSRALTEVIQSENFRTGYLSSGQLNVLHGVLGKSYSIRNK